MSFGSPMQHKIASLIALSILTTAQAQAAQCNSTFTGIPEIQGTEQVSPLVGQTLTTQGVIQAVLYPESKQPRVLLGSVQADNNPKTSEAIVLIDHEMARLAKVGQHWQLTGTVREIDGLTTLTNPTNNLLCGEKPLQPSTTVKLPLASLAEWEQYEGMLLNFAQPLIVNDSYTLARFGELTLADKRLLVATEVTTPGEKANAFEQQQKLGELVIDDGKFGQNVYPVRFPIGGLSAQNSVRVGDTVEQVEGHLLQTKQGFRLVVAKDPVFTRSNPRPPAPAAKTEGALRVASFNVLNFFTGDGSASAFPTKRGASSPAELTRQQAKMIAALAAMDADVIGLLEVENNGFDQGSAIATLVNALNTHVGGNVYQAVQPSERPGTDDIMVAMIYRTAAVSEVGKAAVITKAPFERGSRPPLAQSFSHKASGKVVTISINHFKSKGSCPKQQTADSDLGDGQGCWTPTRVAAAKALTAWLNTNPTGHATELKLIMGDLNAYRQEQPLQQLAQDGWLHLAKAGEIHTSYVFKGRSGSLDHALASPALQQKLQQFSHWHINADEPEVLDYNMEHKSKAQIESWYQPDPYRSSDHDPLYMDFKF